MEFDRHALVLLCRPPDAPPLSDEEADEIQELHLGHLRAMREAGKLVCAGPFADRQDESLRGLCVYRTSVDEARELAARDPAVRRGRMTPVVMTWLTPKGELRFE